MTRRDWAAIFGTTLGAFMAILDIQITNASLREIQGSLGLDVFEGGWVSTSYLIAETVVIPLTAYLSKVFGMRRYLLFNCAAFILASIGCSLSWSLGSMIFFRVCQGLSGGTLIPMAFQAMLIFMPPEKKNTGLALFGITATLAPTLGPSLGGWLTDAYGWRSIFLINVLPGTLMMAAIRYGIPRAPFDRALLRKIDVFGVLTMSVSLGTLTYILEEGAPLEWFGDPHIRACFLVCALSSALFVAHTLLKTRGEHLLKFRLLADRNFGLAAAITTLAALALYGGIYALSLYLNQIQDYSAQGIGAVMMWVGIPQLFVMPLLPALMKRVDLRLLAIIGMALFAFSNYINSGLNIDYSGDQFRLSLIVRAIGQPLFMIPLSAMGMALISREDSGQAAAIYNVMRNLGGSIGIALTGSMLINRTNMHLRNALDYVSLYNGNTTDRLTGIQRLFMLKGMDPPRAKSAALKMLHLISQRESVIQSFSDVFFCMSIGLVVCVALIFLLGKVESAGEAPIE